MLRCEGWFMQYFRLKAVFFKLQELIESFGAERRSRTNYVVSRTYYIVVGDFGQLKIIRYMYDEIVCGTAGGYLLERAIVILIEKLHCLLHVLLRNVPLH